MISSEGSGVVVVEAAPIDVASDILSAPGKSCTEWKFLAPDSK